MAAPQNQGPRLSEADGVWGRPPQSLDLYVGGLPFGMTAVEVRDMFDSEGFPVSSVKVRGRLSVVSPCPFAHALPPCWVSRCTARPAQLIIDRGEHRSKGYGFVGMEVREGADVCSS